MATLLRQFQPDRRRDLTAHHPKQPRRMASPEVRRGRGHTNMPTTPQSLVQGGHYLLARLLVAFRRRQDTRQGEC
jgi:hypothetical protein